MDYQLRQSAIRLMASSWLKSRINKDKRQVLDSADQVWLYNFGYAMDLDSQIPVRVHVIHVGNVYFWNQIGFPVFNSDVREMFSTTRNFENPVVAAVCLIWRLVYNYALALTVIGHRKTTCHKLLSVLGVGWGGKAFCCPNDCVGSPTAAAYAILWTCELALNILLSHGSWKLQIIRAAEQSSWKC